MKNRLIKTIALVLTVSGLGTIQAQSSNDIAQALFAAEASAKGWLNFERFQDEKGKWGVETKTYDYKRKVVIKPRYDFISETYIEEWYSDGLAEVARNNKYGFIDEDGKEVVPLKYDFVGSFSDDMVGVGIGGTWNGGKYSGGKWGFVDKTGKEVISLKYDMVSEFVEGSAKIKLNGKWGIVSTAGKEIVSPKYDLITYFSEGLAPVGYTITGKLGFIDRIGKEVIPIIYDKVGHFEGGKAKVVLNDREFFIDRTGREVK